jgi:hypothetical protein
MKLYKLYLAKPLLVFYLIMLAVLVFAGAIGIIVGVIGKFGPDGPRHGSSSFGSALNFSSLTCG